MRSMLTHKRSIPALALLVVLAAAGVGYAAIPGPGGVIKGCYATTEGLLLGIPHSKGDTRIVDSGEACRSYEKTLPWNQTGPQGPRATRAYRGSKASRATPGRSARPV
jgi:hypothetical protein